MELWSRSNQSLHAFSAMALSIGIHGILLASLYARHLLVPESSPFASTKLAGQTFDVDALGRPADDEVAAAAAKALATPPRAPEAEEPPRPQDDVPAAKSPDPPPTDETNPQVDDDEAPPRPDQRPPEPIAHPTTAPPSSTRPVDPFDLSTLPGAPSSKEPPQAASGPEAAPTQGAYGEEGVTASRVDVFSALLRQLPLAAKADPAWLALPLGDAGRVEFRLLVDDQGKLGPVELTESKDLPIPAHLKRAVPLALRFLEHARVKLSPDGEAGSQRLALVATVHRRAPDPANPSALGVRAFGLGGGEPPSTVYFTYFSGHHIEIEMWRLP